MNSVQILYTSCISLIIAGLLSACSFSLEKLSAPPAVDVPIAKYQLSELTYANIYARVIRKNCVGCHGEAGGVNLESYDSTKSHLQSIYQAVYISQRMPKRPGPDLDSEQLDFLKAWIQAGAPELAPDTGGPQEPTPVPPLQPNFESIKYHILEPKCFICHAPGKAVARISLATKEDILNSPLDLVIPGNPDESGLILAIMSDDPRRVMPPPKDEHGNATGYTKLKPAEIQAINDWILNGAKD